ncbi:uncharacterized protein LOC111297621 [Durio zibethinus]|uniref:Uncharacterized protein LOC111297621 n=1 Tax=Durio zibethinus TaxID=66656 RepID=A0A6P5Z6M8_DURZI|nr:uncharacterized protein LOC111297621 [Durio zibethinus]
MGYTPLHCLVMKETDRVLLTRFLNAFPDCIHDHVAEITNNFKNRDDETMLHIAVSNDQPEPEIMRLLTDLRIDITAKNSKSSTALDILKDRTQGDSINIKKCVNILRHPWGLKASSRKIPWFILQLLSQWGYEIKHMSADRGNALLVVTVLILTATYQSTLSPPGGVLQANAESNDQKFSGLQIYLGSKNTSHHWFILVRSDAISVDATLLPPGFCTDYRSTK